MTEQDCKDFFDGKTELRQRSVWVIRIKEIDYYWQKPPKLEIEHSCIQEVAYIKATGSLMLIHNEPPRHPYDYYRIKIPNDYTWYKPSVVFLDKKEAQTARKKMFEEMLSKLGEQMDERFRNNIEYAEKNLQKERENREFWRNWMKEHSGEEEENEASK